MVLSNTSVDQDYQLDKEGCLKCQQGLFYSLVG